MQNLLETLGQLIRTRWSQRDNTQRHSRTFACRCGNHVFFRNSQCLSCNAPLGYLPHEAELVALDPGPRAGTWRVDGSESLYKSCGNRELPARCNWMLAADDLQSLCTACRLNRTIPNIDDADNARYWALIVKESVQKCGRLRGRRSGFDSLVRRPSSATLAAIERSEANHAHDHRSSNRRCHGIICPRPNRHHRAVG
jgi:hypothetical protein